MLTQFYQIVFDLNADGTGPDPVGRFPTEAAARQFAKDVLSLRTDWQVRFFNAREGAPIATTPRTTHP